MRPKTRLFDQAELFRSRLDNMLDQRHSLFKLAGKIDWLVFDECYGMVYAEVGRPGIPTRLMVGLHYLKYSFNMSDESVVQGFVENPYWQYFCGFEYFQHELPIDPSSMTRWRSRVGSEGAEIMLKVTIATAKQEGMLTDSEAKRVVVDTTVMEKAIDFPTDAKLYEKARRKLVKEAQNRGIKLRQSYARVGPRTAMKQGRYAHAKQFKRSRKATKHLRTILGRVIRDIRRNEPNPDASLENLLSLAERLHAQKRHDKNKLYSFWAPETECISKGKAHKRYEFGCKAGVVTTAKDCWVIGSQAFHGNPYDGHTLAASIEQAEAITDIKIKQAFVDKGYRGSKDSVPEVEVFFPGAKGRSKELKRWMRRRSSVEPVIGHLKSDNRMNHNHLHGQLGDQMNALLAGSGFNLRKLLRELSRAFFWLRVVVLADFWQNKMGRQAQFCRV